jgi:hypothetical protein
VIFITGKIILATNILLRLTFTYGSSSGASSSASVEKDWFMAS